MNLVTKQVTFANCKQSTSAYQKPVFTQPSMYKMDDFLDDMISCDEMLETDEFCDQAASQGHNQDGNKSSLVTNQVDHCDKFAESVELPILPGVVKGIWKRVSYTIYRDVEVESNPSNNARAEEEPAEVQESSEEQEEVIEEILAEMHQLLKTQKKSKAKKYQDIIRESIEFTLDDEEQFDGSYDLQPFEQEDELEYQEIKQKVMHILQR